MRGCGIAGMLAVLLLCTSCGKETNNTLFDGMHTDDLRLYRYDGGEVEVYKIVTTGTHRSVKEDRLIEDLRGAAAEPAVRAAVEFPIYAISCGTAGEEDRFLAAWSDGYLYTADGAVYEFDYNFSKLVNRYDFEKQRGDPAPETLPCMYYMVLGEDGWDTELLREVVKSSPAEGMGVSLKERTEEQVVLRLVNYGEEEWSYYNRYSLHGKLDGVWYHLPVKTERAEGKLDIREIPVGSSAEIVGDLSVYGGLPEGEYRLVLEGAGSGWEIYYEFTISE